MEGILGMRRTIGALLAAGVLVTLITGTAAAAPRNHLVSGTSLVTTACVNGSDQMVFRIDWAGQTFAQNEILTVTWTLNGKGTASPVQNLYSGPYDDPSFADFTSDALVGPAGPIAWDSWSTIDTSVAGALNDTAKRIHRGGGWPAC
jgi:hypothetical protein